MESSRVEFIAQVLERNDVAQLTIHHKEWLSELLEYIRKLSVSNKDMQIRIARAKK